MKAIRIRVEGKVQGVGYRAATVGQARALGISGWVKNKLDGSVLIHAQGSEQQCQQLIEWTWQGPSFAKVSAVNVEDTELQQLSAFDVRHSH